MPDRCLELIACFGIKATSSSNFDENLQFLSHFPIKSCPSCLKLNT
jgi:hypothetical protein